MQEIISAIWLQDFDALLELNSLHVLLLLLGVVLFLESSFVFLPLPGDGLVLFVGGMVGLGAIDFSSALMLLTSASFLGSIIAYLQGRWLHNTPFMRKAEQTLPDESLPKAKKTIKPIRIFVPVRFAVCPICSRTDPNVDGRCTTQRNKNVDC